MSFLVPIPQSRARIFPLGEYEERQESDSLPRMAGGCGDEVAEVSCGCVKEEAGPVLRCRRQVHGDGDKASLFTNSHVIDNADSQGKPANTDTSKEQSDDDGDFEEITDPANAKKMRRMLSNRESARRSRKRKQTHLSDLESQVSRLTTENASLLKRLADMTQKYKDSTLDNQNLIVNVETMRRKATEVVKRNKMLNCPHTEFQCSECVPLNMWCWPF